MIEKCAICGKEDSRRWMYSFNVGRKTKWMCWECYKESQRQATASDLQRKHKLHKIAETKKVNK